MIDHVLQGLRPIRYARRFQRTDMAQLINVSPSSYTRFERGERRIYFDKVVIIADRLGVLTDDLRKPLTEDAAKQLCDMRDKAAIAAGTFDRTLWTPGAALPPAPPPLTSAPPPPPVASALDDSGNVSAAAELTAWNMD